MHSLEGSPQLTGETDAPISRDLAPSRKRRQQQGAPRLYGVIDPLGIDRDQSHLPVVQPVAETHALTQLAAMLSGPAGVGQKTILQQEDRRAALHKLDRRAHGRSRPQQL